MTADLPPGHDELVQKGLPCPDQKGCGSSDAAALYGDGHLTCFSGSHDPATKTYSPQRLTQMGYEHRLGDDHPAAPRRTAPVVTPETAEMEADLRKAKVSHITSRKLTKETAAAWDYRVRKNSKGEVEELAPFRDTTGRLLGIKVRNTGVDGLGKDFFGIGKVAGLLWGRHRYGDAEKRHDGKPTWVLITEGEHDAMAVSQAMGVNYHITSLPQGTDSAAKALKDNLEWLLTHDRVILGFDQDAAGRDTMEECVALFPPGRLFIAKWPNAKDASELLQRGLSGDITRVVWNPTPYRPDGMVDARDLTEACMAPVIRGIPWAWDGLTELTYGRRPQETIALGSGTGMGKTDLIMEQVAADLQGRTKSGAEYPPQGWAMFAFEGGGPAKTKNTVAGKIGRKRFHKSVEDLEGGFEWTPEEKRAVLDRMDGELWNGGGKLFIYDARGLASWDAIKDKMRYLRQSEGVRHFLIDPLSAMVTEEEDERKEIDRIVLAFTKLMEELDAHGYLVSHLTRPSLGPSHEEGGKVQLRQFRGSNAIGMFTYFVIGMERNQQADTEEERARSTIRIVKDRFTGDSTGHTFQLVYDRFTGSLDEPVRGSDIV